MVQKPEDSVQNLHTLLVALSNMKGTCKAGFICLALRAVLIFFFSINIIISNKTIQLYVNDWWLVSGWLSSVEHQESEGNTNFKK